MVIEHKFIYGDRSIKFNEDYLYVDYVKNLHELTEWEERLERNNTKYAVYLAHLMIGRNPNRGNYYKYTMIIKPGDSNDV